MKVICFIPIEVIKLTSLNKKYLLKFSTLSSGHYFVVIILNVLCILLKNIRQYVNFYNIYNIYFNKTKQINKLIN